jgi:CDP-6-deoxy-D-xylo-4-hexulose-3-dehydrase
MGLNVQNFEKKFAEFVGSKYAVMVNSGSSANLVAATVIKDQDGLNLEKRTVIVPALSWSTTYFPWIQNGYKLKFIDIDTSTFNMDLTNLISHITPDVVGICIPHILGADAGIEQICKIAREMNIWVHEDTCESLGANAISGGEKLLGSFSRVGTYSFFRSHHISTMEGGMLVTDDVDLYHRAMAVRAHGWSRNIPVNSVLGNNGADEWMDKFSFYTQGYNLRPLEISASIGLTQMKQIQSFLSFRRSNAEYLKQIMCEVPWIKLQNQPTQGSWMAFGFVIDEEGLERSDLISCLSQLDFETRPIVTGNFLRQPVMKTLDESIIANGSFPNADKIHYKGFMLGNHGRDIRGEIDEFAKVLFDFYSK